jgi:hypothetical protein
MYKYSVETMSNYNSYISKGTHMKTILKFIADFFTSVGEASYAAHLARNGQYERAKAQITK